MKTTRILSLLLAVLMITTSVFAAPVAVSTVNVASEPAEVQETQEAELPEVMEVEEETSLMAEGEYLLGEYSFDTSAEDWGYLQQQYTTEAAPNTKLNCYTGGLDNGAYRITSESGTVVSKADGKTYGKEFRFQNRSLNFNTEDITRIEFRVKNNTGARQSAKFYWETTKYSMDEKRTKSFEYDASDWTIISLDVSDLTAENGWTGKLIGFRFNPGNMNNTPAGTTHYIDYIRFYTDTNPVIPGYNLLTGTAQPLDFDDGNFAISTSNSKVVTHKGARVFATSHGVAEIVDSPVAGDTNNKVFKLGGLSVEANKTIFPIISNFGDYLPERKDGRPIFVAAAIALVGDNLKSTDKYNCGLRIGADDNTSNYLNMYDLLPAYTTSQTVTAWSYHGAKDDKSTLKPGTFVFSVGTTADGPSTPIIYMDDIYMTYYYKVTYMNGDEVVDTKYVLDDGNGKILTSFNPAAQGVALPEGMKYWSLAPEGKEVTSVSLNHEDIVLYASAPQPAKPGHNILTGTAQPLDFEGANYEGVSLTVSKGASGYLYDNAKNKIFEFDNYARSYEVVSSPVDGETNNVLRLSNFKYYASLTSTTAATYPSLRFKGYSYHSDNRPVLLKFKTALANTDEMRNVAGATALRYKYDAYDGDWATGGNLPACTSSQKPAWQNVTFKDAVSKTAPASISWTLSVDLDKVVRESGTSTTLWPKENSVLPYIYIDDISYIPYYMVTFKNGNEVVATKYVLDDGNGNLLTSFDPHTLGVKFPEGYTGWSTTVGGKKVDSVALENEDIVLYAVNGYYNDETVAFFDFESQDAITDYWTPTRYKNADEKIDSADFVENIPGAKNAMKGTATKCYSQEGSEEYSYDCIFQLEDKMNIPLGSIDRIEVRVKVENVTERYTGSNNVACENISDDHASFYLKLGKSFYQKDVRYDTLTPDANGWYVINVPVESFTCTSGEKKPIYECVDNTATVSVVRFDVSSTDGVHYLDYVKLYGVRDKIKPIDEFAPKYIDELSLRTDSVETTGVRFKASMPNITRSNSRMTEYGWIVALVDTLGENELTHEFENYVSGVAYDRANKIDKIFDTKGDVTIFTAVMTGIPAQYAHLELAIRPYSRTCGGYIYSETVCISPREAAQRVKDKYPEFYENNKAYMDSLLGT